MRLGVAVRRVAEGVDGVHVALGHVEAVALHVAYEGGEGDERRREEEEAPPVHHVHVQRHARAQAVEALERRRERVEPAVPVLGQEGVRVLARLLDVGLRVDRAHVLGQHHRVLHRAPTAGANTGDGASERPASQAHGAALGRAVGPLERQTDARAGTSRGVFTTRRHRSCRYRAALSTCLPSVSLIPPSRPCRAATSFSVPRPNHDLRLLLG